MVITPYSIILQHTQNEAVGRVLDRMATRPLAPHIRAHLVRALTPYGAPLLERLANNGLKLEISKDGYAHYDAGSKTVTLTTESFDEDSDPPYRDYMIVHEFAHAMDFLFEPSKGPLSERTDLGISAHRTRLGESYRALLGEYRRIEEERRQQGTWGPAPGWPTARVYYEDFITTVEVVTGKRLPERPARGHVTILDTTTRPTEYFADAVYCYLHQDALKRWQYTLPTGQSFSHPYPPNRSHLAERDARMHAALQRFFNNGGTRAEDLTVER